jgi:glycerol kinase
MSVMESYILALDQGTTSSRAIVFDRTGEPRSLFQKEFRQIYPRPGWVEHDPEEIWETQLLAAREALKKAALSPGQIAAIGITNQRETVVFWERASGRALGNAIVWQCRRSADLCAELKKRGLEDTFTDKTGLLLDPYFSGTKISWLLNRQPELRERAQAGEICCGTVDSWLLYKLTGRHLTEPSNASRTLLYNIHQGRWDEELLKILGVPLALLPEVVPSCSVFGRTRRELFGAEIAVGGAAGDQQAALFGQACFEAGEAKNTYGTGCFALLHTGSRPVVSKNRLLTTIAWDLGGGPEYALEGSVFIAGAVIQWLRDQLDVIAAAPDSEALAASVPDSGGVVFVPAFVGLGAPHWDPDARGAILGLTRGSGKAELTRAALESIAYQSYDLIEALAKDSGQRIETLKVDGGASLNGFLMQFQADILGIPVQLPAVAETTALGAAYLAGLSCGYWKSREDIAGNWRLRREYRPQMEADRRQALLALWRQALRAARGFT